MRAWPFVLSALAVAMAVARPMLQARPAGAAEPPASGPPAALPPSTDAASPPNAMPPATAASAPPAARPDTATSRWGSSRLVRASYASSITPVPLIRLHSWTLHIVDAAGNPVTGAEVSIVGGMPEHTHGFPTVPEVHELGAGDYRVDGLKFHMPGQWVVVLAIHLMDGARDTVRFEVDVQ